MGDKWLEVLENYEVELKSSSKGRYAQLLETDTGLLQLRPHQGSLSRLKSEYDFKERLFSCGLENIDRLIHNREGELFTADRYGNFYALRRYFHGREISASNMTELDLAVENLARLHLAGRKIREEICAGEAAPAVRTNYDLPRRNRELKRVRAYIGRRGSKSKFEEAYLKVYEQFFGQARKAESKLADLFESLGEGELKYFERHTGYCHGDYNNHNLLFTREKEIATVGFDKFYVGSQLSDLYYFARKSVEKNGYSFEVLKRIIEGYGRHIELVRTDLEYIYILFYYPERFYKISSRYLNGSKVRISPVALEKLDKIIGSERKKQQLLANYRDIFLHI